MLNFQNGGIFLNTFTLLSWSHHHSGSRESPHPPDSPLSGSPDIYILLNRKTNWTHPHVPEQNSYNSLHIPHILHYGIILYGLDWESTHSFVPKDGLVKLTSNNSVHPGSCLRDILHNLRSLFSYRSWSAVRLSQKKKPINMMNLLKNHSGSCHNADFRYSDGDWPLIFLNTFEKYFSSLNPTL